MTDAGGSRSDTASPGRLRRGRHFAIAYVETVAGEIACHITGYKATVGDSTVHPTEERSNMAGVVRRG